MAVVNCKLVVIFVMIMAVAVTAVDASVGGHHQQQPIMGWIPTTISTCKGSIGDGLAREELELDSESEMISRRFLAANNFISYGALKRNVVPCSIRGGSYYNCKPGAEANPYDRGCSHLARCRGGSYF